MNDKQTVIDHFKWYYANGYITARDGNAAYRTGEFYMVTESGARKHNLGEMDFGMVDLGGNSMGGFSPSIETGAHVAVLSTSGKNASVHVHSPNTVALAALFDSTGLCTPKSHDLERLLNNNWPELFRYTKVGYTVPFYEPGSSILHRTIEGSMAKADICIMQRHGVLAAGDTLDQCMEHIVRLEHISTILLKIVMASGNMESIL